MTEEFTSCPTCGPMCCDIDEDTGKCAGRCNAYGIHIEDQKPVALKLDAMTVARWMRQEAHRGNVSASSRAWFQAKKADKAGIGALIDCLRQLEHEAGEQ